MDRCFKTIILLCLLAPAAKLFGCPPGQNEEWVCHNDSLKGEKGACLTEPYAGGDCHKECVVLSRDCPNGRKPPCSLGIVWDCHKGTCLKSQENGGGGCNYKCLNAKNCPSEFKTHIRHCHIRRVIEDRWGKLVKPELACGEDYEMARGTLEAQAKALYEHRYPPIHGARKMVVGPRAQIIYCCNIEGKDIKPRNIIEPRYQDFDVAVE